MRKGFNLSGNLVKFYRSLQTGHLGHFLGHFSLTEKVNWCRRSYFSLMPAKILWSASYILVTLALKIGCLRYKFQLYTVSRSWDTKGGCAVPSTHTIIVHSYVDLLLCTRISDIVCDEVVQPPVFSTFRYGYEVEFSPGMPFWWCAQKLKVASRINKRNFKVTGCL